MKMFLKTFCVHALSFFPSIFGLCFLRFLSADHYKHLSNLDSLPLITHSERLSDGCWMGMWTSAGKVSKSSGCCEAFVVFSFHRQKRKFQAPTQHGASIQSELCKDFYPSSFFLENERNFLFARLDVRWWWEEEKKSWEKRKIFNYDSKVSLKFISCEAPSSLSTRKKRKVSTYTTQRYIVLQPEKKYKRNIPKTRRRWRCSTLSLLELLPRSFLS